MTVNLDDLVSAAQRGDQDALEGVVRGIQDRVHHLAMRMLVNPEDALEATQEILILVITKLSTFQGDSAFHTWVYRVAANYLLSARKMLDRDQGPSFEMFRADLENGLVAAPATSAEDVVMLNELRISCTMAMLLCLDLKHRLAYVLGDILELDHGDAAGILGISKANYRKRLSRGRAEVVAFTSRNCGLANAAAKCTCPRRLPAATALGRVRPGNIAYALVGAPAYGDVLSKVRKVEGALKTLKLQTATPQFKSPEDLSVRISRIVGGA
ncbi:MAG: RNA polymerase sigma factor [Proteobacteria bacterium]|nr:RNA polymerase sigma factor [Pseudomonadota bacterium]